MTARIFNIQKFCLHDGPGIRTTVFFKGCNLRCKWCANPESQKPDMQITWDSRKCTGCGKCAQVCPRGAKKPGNAGCVACGACVSVCPAGAIGKEGREATVEQILTEVLKDKVFYDHSSGGVTLSGGEVLLQGDFVKALADRLRKQGVHVAIETAGAVSESIFASVVQKMDYVLMDLKHYDTDKHLAGTGIGNVQVLANLRYLRSSGIPYTVRIPVIPGFNDAPEDASGFARLLTELDIKAVELLPFHQLGRHKYDLMNMDYEYGDFPQLHPEDLTEYRQRLEQYSIDVKV